jgi:hypothetical protein
MHYIYTQIIIWGTRMYSEPVALMTEKFLSPGTICVQGVFVSGTPNESFGMYSISR